MAGCRPLTRKEERALLKVARKSSPRDRALITAQLMTGFRISEILSLTIASILKDGAILSKVGIAPRHLKGGYGKTRWIPILPELSRALGVLLRHYQVRFALDPGLPLFISRQDNAQGTARSISRETARLVIMNAFAKAGIENDGRLGTHVLRKTFARTIYEHCGKDMMVLRKALNHSSVSVTERYLEVVEEDVIRAVKSCDRSRVRKPKEAFQVPATAAFPTLPAGDQKDAPKEPVRRAPDEPTTGQQLWLFGPPNAA